MTVRTSRFARLPGDRRVDDHPVVAQPDHRARRRGRAGPSPRRSADRRAARSASRRRTARRDRSRPSLQRLLARLARRRPGPGRVRAVRSRPRLRGQSTSTPRSRQRAHAVLEQADQLVGVEGDLVGHPQLQQPVEHRPRVGRGPQRDAWRGCGPGRRSRGWPPGRTRPTARRRRRRGAGSARRAPAAPAAPSRRPAPPRRPPPAARGVTSCGQVVGRRGPVPGDPRLQPRVELGLPHLGGPPPAGPVSAPDPSAPEGGDASPGRRAAWCRPRPRAPRARAARRPRRRARGGRGPGPAARSAPRPRRRAPPAATRCAPRRARTCPAATSRIPSSTAPVSSATLGCRSSRAWALVSTGSAPRIGRRTVRPSSVNSTTESRGGCPRRKDAGPVTGTKLRTDLRTARHHGDATAGVGWEHDANAPGRHKVPRSTGGPGQDS